MDKPIIGRPFTPETAPRGGGKAGRRWKSSILRTNAELIAKGKDVAPLDVLKGFAADEDLDEGLRVTAATAAARYVHRPMPQAVELSGQVQIRRSFAEAVAEQSAIDAALKSEGNDEGSGD